MFNSSKLHSERSNFLQNPYFRYVKKVKTSKVKPLVQFFPTIRVIVNKSRVEVSLVDEIERVSVAYLEFIIKCLLGKNYFLSHLYFLQLFSANAKIFEREEFKKFFAPTNLKRFPSKVSHNPTRPPIFSPASFCFVKLRQFKV